MSITRWLAGLKRAQVLKRAGCPERINDYSPWADWYMTEADRRSKNPRGDKRRYLMPYWDADGKYIHHSEGDVVPMLETSLGTAYYRIVKIKRPGPWYDALPSDDGRSYWLEFDHVEGTVAA